jgi:uncharacterized protein with GYD domain
MPKFLLMASYTADGVKGVMKDGGTKRKQAAEAALKSVGGRVEAVYFALGEYDLYAVVDAPDNATVTAAAMAINASGAARIQTVALLTPEEIDQAIQKRPAYTPPGQ